MFVFLVGPLGFLSSSPPPDGDLHSLPMLLLAVCMSIV